MRKNAQTTPGALPPTVTWERERKKKGRKKEKKRHRYRDIKTDMIVIIPHRRIASHRHIIMHSASARAQYQGPSTRILPPIPAGHVHIHFHTHHPHSHPSTPSPCPSNLRR
ncbi:hypothetical protein VTK26DRAFT_2448 [Humicola hyalothermophila]